MSLVQGLQISSAAQGAVLTPEQKRFNTLIRQIEQARGTLAEWRDNIPLYGQAYLKRVVPLLQSLAAARRDWAFALDRLLDQPGWNKLEQGTLRELVCDSVAELLAAPDADDAALKALFDKHSDVDFETEQQRTRLAMKDMMEAVTGLDLGEDDEIASDEDLLERMHAGLAGQAARQQAAENARASHASGRRQAAAQKRREAEVQLATQSVREIFRKLASALHPDRETDPERHSAKTALMQRANQAYAANDLLALLELQLQIEQVDAGQIANAGGQRLKQYNKLLGRQLAELKVEACRMEDDFRAEFGLPPGRGMNPARLDASIGRNAQQLQAGLALFQRDMRMLADRAATKRWLKRERQQRQREDMFDAELGFS